MLTGCDAWFSWSGYLSSMPCSEGTFFVAIGLPFTVFIDLMNVEINSYAVKDAITFAIARRSCRAVKARYNRLRLAVTTDAFIITIAVQSYPQAHITFPFYNIFKNFS